MSIERFEDLIAWQKARELTKDMYRISQHAAFSRDFGLRDQIRRAAISVMANLAEWFERGGRSEFHQFLVVSKASCAEVRSLLYVALDADYLSQEEFEHLQGKAAELGRIIGGLRSAVRKQRELE
jgi:four helix bundle protein